MAVIGICTAKNDFSYCVLEGNKSNPKLITESVDKITIQENAELVNWYNSYFQNLLGKYQPEKIGIKLSLDARKEQIAYWYYPVALLHFLCYQKGIITQEFVVKNFTPSKFDLEKDSDIYGYIDTEFPANTKRKRNEHYAFLSAWIMLS